MTRECAHCNTVLNVEIVPIGTPTAEFIPATPPIPQDAFGHESGDPGPDSPIPHDAFGPAPSGEPMPQHAATPTSHTREKNQCRILRHSPHPGEEHPAGYGNGRDGVAGDDTWTNAGWRSA
jgi:hypothetical protein